MFHLVIEDCSSSGLPGTRFTRCANSPMSTKSLVLTLVDGKLSIIVIRNNICFIITFLTLCHNSGESLAILKVPKWPARLCNERKTKNSLTAN